jgi:hypothetical protein
VSYAHDERRAMIAFALGVYSNPDAPSADRDAALRRLTADTREPDLSKLSTSELVELTNATRTAMALLALARGEPYSAPTLATVPLSSFGHDAPTGEANATTSPPVVTEPEQPVVTEQPKVIELPAAIAPRRVTLAEIKGSLLARR